MEFHKITGSGNDFVVVNNLKGVIRRRSALAVAMCRQKFGVGADGLLLVEPSAAADYRMRIFNADGSEAEMCGNGLRCFIRFIRETRLSGKAAFTIETGAGLYRARIRGERVSITMFLRGEPRLDMRIAVGGRQMAVHHLNTGVPHTVIIVPDVAAVPVRELGPSLRHHRAFAPAGTNVDWLQVVTPRTCSVRTFERGVEDETLACGTGVVASVLCGILLGRLRSPVDVTVRSGEHLSVTVSEDLRNILFEGGTLVAFKGSWERW
jgi:diaminopimelate epimerase